MTRLILVGAGHAHLVALRALADDPPPNTSIVLISPERFATYTGMVPGYLAGQYELRQLQIDAVALAARAGAEFVASRVDAIDSNRGVLDLHPRGEQAYDVVSFDIGAEPAASDRVRDHSRTVTVKPIDVATRKLSTELDRPGPPGGRSVVIVGAGTGGVELAFVVAARLRSEPNSHVTICDRADRPAIERGERTARAIERAFEQRGIRFLGCVEIAAVETEAVVFGDGTRLTADLVVWATGAAAPTLFAAAGLPVDDRGFVQIDQELRVAGTDHMFAAGDCASMPSHPALAKAGVIAVRQGAILAANLPAALARRPLRRFTPQRSFLSLLNTGDGAAILSYRGFAWHSRAVWWLKDRIDRGFVRRHDPLAE